MFTSAEALTIFGATYAALYARFASQWGYIANLYNQIKQSEVDAAGSAQAAAPATSISGTAVSPSPSDAALVLAQWKAGFIEDALALHMASKPSIAGVIGAWFKDQYVKDAFMNSTRRTPPRRSRRCRSSWCSRELRSSLMKRSVASFRWAVFFLTSIAGGCETPSNSRAPPSQC
ncbi:unnamed protein product [Brugia timori]|uniref:PPE family protein n=1 Tax=Brugia timori TaxID=42155 RepID=A0A0R3RAE5_9BILA|nr:unnamed protein product [Brugia timori]